MNPVTSALSSVTALTQTLLLRQGLPAGDVEALVKAMGQELAVKYLGQGAEGAELELPGGRIITAQGEVPFPEGTQLRVRVASENGTLKLQTLEAKPPATPNLLAPLLQGEAASLIAQLQQPSPALELAPLVQLMRLMAAAPEAAPPTLETLTQAIAALPKDMAASLARVLGGEVTESPAALAQRILGAKDATPVATATELLTRLQLLLKQSGLAPEPRAAIDTWLQSLLGRKAPEAPGARDLLPSQGSRILSGADLAKVSAALGKTTAPPLQVPDVWEAWIKGAVRTLADPELAPREAPFHAVQAKENTAFFEIPVPWAGGKPLQLWVEKDAPEARGSDSDSVTRVLLGLSLTRLGETRVGLQRSGSALAVRIWTEHPELLEAQQHEIEQELQEIAATVDVRVLPLGPGPVPELRAVVVGASWHALG
ncbi:MAG: hypothetical protein WAT51_13920 [Holophaga sp.]